MTEAPASREVAFSRPGLPDVSGETEGPTGGGWGLCSGRWAGGGAEREAEGRVCVRACPCVRVQEHARAPVSWGPALWIWGPEPWLRLRLSDLQATWSHRVRQPSAL